MNALLAAQAVMLCLAAGWKLSHLARAPRDLPLRCVAACLVCGAAAFPFGIAAMLRPASPATPWVMLSHDSLLLGMAYTLDCFFLFSLLTASAAAQAAARRAIALTAAVTALAVSAAAVPAGTDMASQSVPAAAVLYLAFDLFVAYFLADACRWARHSSKDVAPALERGLRLAWAGLAMMVAGVVPLAAVVILRWARLPSPAVMVTVGGLLVLSGILVFLAGICYPGAIMRLAAARVWARHRRLYRQLSPLWTELHHAFPQDALVRAPTTEWRDVLGLRGVHRRYYRRVIECRDGLVRISPRLAQQDRADPGQPLASQLLIALRSLPFDPLIPSPAAPVAIPVTADLDADAAELARLSRELTTARASTRHADPTERTTGT